MSLNLPPPPDLSHHHQVVIQPCATCRRRWIVLDDDAGFTAEIPGVALACCTAMILRMTGRGQ